MLLDLIYHLQPSNAYTSASQELPAFSFHNLIHVLQVIPSSASHKHLTLEPVLKPREGQQHTVMALHSVTELPNTLLYLKPSTRLFPSLGCNHDNLRDTPMQMSNLKVLLYIPLQTHNCQLREAVMFLPIAVLECKRQKY